MSNANLLTLRLTLVAPADDREQLIETHERDPVHRKHSPQTQGLHLHGYVFAIGDETALRTVDRLSRRNKTSGGLPGLCAAADSRVNTKPKLERIALLSSANGY